MKNKLSFYGSCLAAIVVVAWILSPQKMIGNKRSPKIHQTHYEIVNFCAALSQYHTEFGEYPSGTKANILTTLLGENSKKILFLHVDPTLINSTGELMDPWKTPYKINIAGETNFTIRSA